MMQPMRVILGSMAACLLAMSCSSADKVDNETQLTLALSSETEVPKELDAFTLRVISSRTGELRFSQDYFPKSGRDFPTTLAVIPMDEGSLASPLRIELEGRKGATVFLRRQSIVSYFKGRNLLLSLPLRMACFKFADCGPNGTCAGGQCVDAQVQPDKLLDYEERIVFGKEGACFDEQACLGSIAPVSVEDDCSFAIPVDVPEDMGNVAIRWAAAPSRVLGLDAGDPLEGWTRTGRGRGRLSKGVCDSHFQRRGPDGALLVPDWAEKVYFAASCRAKIATVPPCFSKTTLHAGIGAIVP
jgi:hypothetical protein